MEYGMSRTIQHFDFDELVALPRFYTPEKYFYEPFYVFGGRLASLQRFFYVNLKAAREYMIQARRSLMITKAKSESWFDATFHEEMVLQDIDFYNDFLYAAILTQLFSVFENALLEIIKMVRNDLKVSEPISEQKMPIVNRYIKWLSDSAKIDVTFDRDINANLDVLREIRNRFVHEKERDFPAQMVERVQKLKMEALEKQLDEKEHFVWKTFETMSRALKVVEIAVINKLQPIMTKSATKSLL
jgi:hypothetical protein